MHSACSTSDSCTYVRPLKETTTHLSMFLNKDTPCGWENEVIQERSCDMPDVVNKMRLLSRLFCTKYYMFCRDIRCYNNIKRSGKYASDFVQNFADFFLVMLCSANVCIGTHDVSNDPEAMLSFFVVQSFQVKFTTHLTYLQGKHS